MSNPFRVKGALVAGTIPVGGGAGLLPGVQRPVGEAGSGEQLTAFVQGQPASDLEERLARAANKHPAVRSFAFNPQFVNGKILPAAIRLSYALYAPVLYPVQVDPVYPLNTGEERAQAAVNDALLTEWLKGAGGLAAPVVRLSRLELNTQAGADAALGKVV